MTATDINSFLESSLEFLFANQTTWLRIHDRLQSRPELAGALWDGYHSSLNANLECFSNRIITLLSLSNELDEGQSAWLERLERHFSSWNRIYDSLMIQAMTQVRPLGSFRRSLSVASCYNQFFRSQ